MKKFSALFILVFMSFISFSQSDIKTEKIKVDGNCSMCKKRIEDAAYIKGVKRAEWNETDHTLTIVYRTTKTDINTIEKSIAKAGHNADTIKATDEDYNKLPECCHYKTNKGGH